MKKENFPGNQGHGPNWSFPVFPLTIMHIDVRVGISSDRQEISLWKLEVFANSLSPP